MPEATVGTLQEWLEKDLDLPEHQLSQTNDATGSCQQDFECPLLWLVKTEGNRQCRKGSTGDGCAGDSVWMENVVRCCARDEKVIEFMNSCKQGGIIIRKRKPVQAMTSEEKEKWQKAFRKMQRTTEHDGRRSFNIWHDMVAFHKYSGRKHGAPSIHSSTGFERSFLPWHRYFIWEFETNLQYYGEDCGITMPYTPTHVLHKDSKDDIFGDDALYGPLKPGALSKGVGKNFEFENQKVHRDPATSAQLRSFRNAKFPVNPKSTYAHFSELLESGEANGEEVPVHHNILHGLIGGTMGMFESPADPVFFLHHAWVDYLWWKWQQEGLKIGSREVRSCHNCVTGSEGMFSLEQWVNTFDQPNDIVVPGDRDLKITTQIIYLTADEAKSTTTSTPTTSATTTTTTTGRVCCRAMTAECMACQANKPVGQYCQENPDVVGCKPQECKDTDNGLLDATNDTCASYLRNPAWCGGYDTDKFKANRMCCACTTTTTTTTTKKPREKQCQDTNKDTTDADGDGCKVYRGSGRRYCGKYDDKDFDSMKMCCGCGGGRKPTKSCQDTDNGATDKDGDGCAVYTVEPGYCGGFDKAPFQSKRMCCACGGGSTGGNGGGSGSECTLEIAKNDRNCPVARCMIPENLRRSCTNGEVKIVPEIGSSSSTCCLKLCNFKCVPSENNCRDNDAGLSRQFGWDIQCGQVIQSQSAICESGWFKDLCCASCNSAPNTEMEVGEFNTDPEFFEASYPLWVVLSLIFSSIACLLFVRVFRRCRKPKPDTVNQEKLLTDCTEDMTDES